MTAHFDRALLLYQQSKSDLAESELRRALASDPDYAPAHALLALCLSEQERYEEATQEAQQAVHQAPDLPFAHLALGQVLRDRNHLKEALEATEEAIRLDPFQPDALALLSEIEFHRRHWSEALEAARQGLAIDPEHVTCSNLQAMALVKLNRREEAGTTIDSALTRDPDNPHTHANQGWLLLEQGEPRKAMEHFREALRLDPEMEWARLGIVEAMKARNRFYRLLLHYFLWTSRLSGRAKWGLILGLYFGYQILRGIARSNPEYQLYIMPILLAYIGFALMTWIGNQLFNLILRLDRFGRLALSREQIVASNWIGGCLLTAIVSFGLGVVLPVAALILAGVFCGFLILPLASVFNCSAGWPRKVMIAYSAGMALLGVGGVTCLLTNTPYMGYVRTALLAAILSTWVGNIMAMVTPKR